MTDLNCDAFKDLVAELALGVLHGRERTEAIAHIEQCSACHEELLTMGGLADRFVEITPTAEPPAGFEIGVLSAIAASSPAASPAPKPLPARRRRRLPMLVAAAAVVAVAIGIGGWAVGRATNPGGGSRTVLTAALVSHGQDVGQVVETKGTYPWVYMEVTGLDVKTVRCELKERNGETVRVGTYPLYDGSGSWGAAVAPTAGVTGAQLVDAAGHTVATATFS
jgi:hypothetical protein